MKILAFVIGAILLIGGAENLIETQQATSAQGVGFNAFIVFSLVAGLLLIVWSFKKK